MPNLNQRKSFLAALLCMAFLHCGSSKKSADVSVSDDVPVTGTALNNTAEDKKEDDSKKDDTNKKEPTKEETTLPAPALNPIELQILSPNRSTPPAKPATTTTKPEEKVVAKPTTVKPAVVPPKDMTGQRQNLESTELDQLLASPKLTPEEKALVQEYIKLINSSAGVTRDQTGSMFTLIDKMNGVTSNTTNPVTTEDAEPVESVNVYKNSILPYTFKTFVDPSLGIDQANFNYDKLTELLTKEAILTPEEENLLTTKYFEVLENTNPALLKKYPLDERMKDVLNLYIWNDAFMKTMAKKYENVEPLKSALAMKPKVSALERKMITMLMYGFALNKKLNPKAAQMEITDQIRVYVSNAEPTDDKTKAKKKQKYRILTIGRFDFSNKDKLTDVELAFAKDIGIIWDAVTSNPIGSMAKIDTIGYANKSGTGDKKDEKEGARLANLVKTATQLPFQISSRGNAYPLPGETFESIKNKRVEIELSRVQVNP